MGLLCVALYPNTKKPRATNWGDTALTRGSSDDRAFAARTHWARFPDDNVGIIPNDRLAVLDVDIPDIPDVRALRDTLVQSLSFLSNRSCDDLLRSAPVVQTASGKWHVYLSPVPGVGYFRPHPLIEWRTGDARTQRQTLAPPSVIDDRVYTFVTDNRDLSTLVGFDDDACAALLDLYATSQEHKRTVSRETSSDDARAAWLLRDSDRAEYERVRDLMIEERAQSLASWDEASGKGRNDTFNATVYYVARRVHPDDEIGKDLAREVLIDTYLRELNPLRERKDSRAQLILTFNSAWKSGQAEPALVEDDTLLLSVQEMRREQVSRETATVNAESREHVPFPVDMLPDAAQRAVRAIAAHSQVDESMPGAWAMGVLSVIANQCDVWVETPAGRQPVTTYVVVVAEFADRKSSTLAPFLRPVLTFQRELRANRELRSKAAHMRLKRLQKRMETIQGAFVEAQLDDSDDLSDLIEQEERLNALISDTMRDARLPQFVYDDVTSAKLVEALQYQDGRGALVSPDGAALIGAERWGQSSDTEFTPLLAGYDAETVNQQRKHAGSATVEQMRLSIVQGIQDSPFTSFLRIATPRGLASRLLVVHPRSFSGKRTYSPDDLFPSEELRDWEELTRELLSSWETRQGQTLTLSYDARKLMSDELNRIEPLKRKGEVLYGGEHAYASRITSTLPRVAALLHWAEHHSDPLDLVRLEVSGESMRRAIMLTRAFVYHMSDVYDGGTAPETEDDKQRRKVVAWLKRSNKESTSAGDVRNHVRLTLNGKSVRSVTPELLHFLDGLCDSGVMSKTAGRGNRYVVHRDMLDNFEGDEE